MNRQYHRILIIILKVAKVKIEKKKRPTGTVCGEVPDNSDHDDDPLNEDNGDKMENGL